jgi:glycosyltransferase involved in cell wall biosynthesis
MPLQNLKIAQVIDTLQIGGAERVAVDISNMLVEQGAEVHLIVIRQAGALLEQLDKRVQIKELKFYNKTDIKGWFRLARALRGHDLIHVHMRHTYGRVKLVQVFKMTRTPVLFHDHFGDIKFIKGVPFYLKGIFKPFWYIGVSAELVRWARSSEALHLTDKQSFVLPNTIFRMRHKQRPSSKNGLVIVSNIRRTKNIEHAIEVSNQLGMPLDVIAQVIDEDYFNELKSQSKGQPVRFITDVSDVFPILENYQLALHTAKSETGPLVLLEYLKAGLPFLTYRTGEVAEKMAQLKPEMVMENFELDAWEKRVRLLLETPPDKDELQQIFQEHFGPERYLEQLKNIYECALYS